MHLASKKTTPALTEVSRSHLFGATGVAAAAAAAPVVVGWDVGSFHNNLHKTREYVSAFILYASHFFSSSSSAFSFFSLYFFQGVRTGRLYITCIKCSNNELTNNIGLPTGIFCCGILKNIKMSLVQKLTCSDVCVFHNKTID